MLLKFLSFLAVLLVVHASVEETASQEADPLDKCSETVRRLPKAEWELLKEALDVYENNTNQGFVKILQFQLLLKNHNLPETSTGAIELFAVFLLTDYTHPVVMRSAQLNSIIETVLPNLNEDEDLKLMVETALQLPLMFVDRVFKQLAKQKGPEAAKMAQKSIRSVILTEKYLNSDEETKKAMIMEIALCYMETIGGDSGLEIPLKLINNTLA